MDSGVGFEVSSGIEDGVAICSGYPSMPDPGSYTFASYKIIAFFTLTDVGAFWGQRGGNQEKAIRSIKHNTLCSPESVAHNFAFINY